MKMSGDFRWILAVVVVAALSTLPFIYIANNSRDDYAEGFTAAIGALSIAATVLPFMASKLSPFPQALCILLIAVVFCVGNLIVTYEVCPRPWTKQCALDNADGLSLWLVALGVAITASLSLASNWGKLRHKEPALPQAAPEAPAQREDGHSESIAASGIQPENTTSPTI